MKALIKSQYHLVAKTFAGLEPLLAEEMRKLGISNTRISQRAVSGDGDLAALYRLNLQSRLALKVLLHLKEIPMRQARDLYDGAGLIPWEELLGPDQSAWVEPNVQSKWFDTPSQAAREVRIAMEDRYKARKSAPPKMKADHPDLQVLLHINAFRALVQADSSGASLHRRGYRQGDTAAELNEALAAALVQLSGWEGRGALVLGPGTHDTVAVEAALLGRRTAPGSQRQSFEFQRWRNFDRAVWNTVRQQAVALGRSAAGCVRLMAAQPELLESVRQGLAFYQAEEALDPCPDSLGQYQPDTQGGFLILPWFERTHTPGRVLVDARYGAWQTLIYAPIPLHFSRPADRYWNLFQGMTGFHLYRFDAPGAVIALGASPD